MSIADLRRNLADRLDAAFFHNEATVIRNIRRSRPTAALVPFPWYEEREAEHAELERYRAKYGPLEAGTGRRPWGTSRADAAGED